jgi:hypothetical protein
MIFIDNLGYPGANSNLYSVSNEISQVWCCGDPARSDARSGHLRRYTEEVCHPRCTVLTDRPLVSDAHFISLIQFTFYPID